MLPKAGGLKNIFGKTSEIFSKHKSAFEGIVAASVVIGVNQIVDEVAFECPCVMEEDLSVPCDSLLSSFCLTRDKAAYGYMFIFGPAVTLLFLGFAISVPFWKQITGCCRLEKTNKGNNSQQQEERVRKCRISLRSVCNTFGFALVGFCTWIVLSFIDGDYFACAVTPLPYKFTVIPFQNCSTPIVSRSFFVFFVLKKKIGLKNNF